MLNNDFQVYAVKSYVKLCMYLYVDNIDKYLYRHP